MVQLSRKFWFSLLWIETHHLLHKELGFVALSHFLKQCLSDSRQKNNISNINTQTSDKELFIQCPIILLYTHWFTKLFCIHFLKLFFHLLDSESTVIRKCNREFPLILLLNHTLKLDRNVQSFTQKTAHEFFISLSREVFIYHLHRLR